MRAHSLAVFCLLTFACSKSEGTPGEDDDTGPAMGDGDELTSPPGCREIFEQASCEAQGCWWKGCPPNADCLYFCDDASQQPYGKAACEAGGGVWTECAPTEDCIFKCVMQPSAPSDAGIEPPLCLDSEGKFDCHACTAESACEREGCRWRACPPNADCLHECFPPDVSPAQPDAGEPTVPVDACGKHEDGSACAQAGCDWRMCPLEQGGGYHCVDATRCEGWDQETCEAKEGCVWKECPPNADCAYQCRDPRVDQC